MNKKIYERFHNYLCEVVEYYQEHGSLNKFSFIAKKWGVKAIPKEVFYVNGLHLLPKGHLPSMETSVEVRNILAERDRISHGRVRFNKDDIVAWERNGCRSVAVMEDDTIFSVCLNFRGRANETKRLWMCDELPTDVIIEKPTMSDIKELVVQMSKNLK